MRQRLNLTIHPEVRAFAEEMALKRRWSISQLFEELVEAEWDRRQSAVKEEKDIPKVPASSPKPYPKRRKPSGVRET